MPSGLIDSSGREHGIREGGTKGGASLDFPFPRKKGDATSGRSTKMRTPFPSLYREKR